MDARKDDEFDENAVVNEGLRIAQRRGKKLALSTEKGGLLGLALDGIAGLS